VTNGVATGIVCGG